MIIPHTRVTFINEVKGFGVVATQPIPKGTITWIFDDLDREFSLSQIEQLSPSCREAVMTYSYRNNRGNFVFCWDNEKYINHSFRANCCHTPYNLEIAIRNIEVGEELTDDYGFLNIIEPFEAEPEGTERNIVYPDDLLRYSEIWDGQLRSAFAELLNVDQPLRNAFSTTLWQTVSEVARGEQPMASISSCLFRG
jgi:hypothetical protein